MRRGETGPGRGGLFFGFKKNAGVVFLVYNLVFVVGGLWREARR